MEQDWCVYSLNRSEFLCKGKLEQILGSRGTNFVIDCPAIPPLLYSLHEHLDSFELEMTRIALSRALVLDNIGVPLEVILSFYGVRALLIIMRRELKCTSTDNSVKVAQRWELGNSGTSTAAGARPCYGILTNGTSIEEGGVHIHE